MASTPDLTDEEWDALEGSAYMSAYAYRQRMATEPLAARLHQDSAEAMEAIAEKIRNARPELTSVDRTPRR